MPLVGGCGFELEFVGDDGKRVRRALSTSWDVAFDRLGRPVRSFPSFRGQRSCSGWWWLSSSGVHVGYESWLERDNLMVLDADPDVVAVVSQPFWLSWADGAGRRRRHAPDYFVRCRNGGVVIVDVRADERVEPRDAAVFAMTAAACCSVGWDYRRAGIVDSVLVANLRWLSGYRHPRNRSDAVAAELFSVFKLGRPLFDGAVVAGEPIAVLPTLYHLLWTGHLETDLTVRMDAKTVVTAKPQAVAV